MRRAEGFTSARLFCDRHSDRLTCGVSRHRTGEGTLHLARRVQTIEARPFRFDGRI